MEEYNKESSLRYYQECFEAPFLDETGEYYRHVASKLVSELDVSQYMAVVVSRMQAARRRGQRFLHQTSMTKVSGGRREEGGGRGGGRGEGGGGRREEGGGRREEGGGRSAAELCTEVLKKQP